MIAAIALHRRQRQKERDEGKGRKTGREEREGTKLMNDDEGEMERVRYDERPTKGRWGLQ